MNRRSDQGAKPKLSCVRHSRWNTACTHVRDADGKRRQIYLGKFDSPESWQKYHELAAKVAAKVAAEESIVEFLPGDQKPISEGSPSASVEITIEMLVSKFLRHAEDYYRKPDGRPTREHPNFVLAVRPLLQLYRDELAPRRQ